MDTDTIHEFGSHADWSESFYFNFYDKQNDICAFMRIGLKPNSNEKNMFCFFMLADGSMVGMKDKDAYDNTDLKVKNLQFERLVPEKHWRLSFSGSMNKYSAEALTQENVSFSVDFESLNKIFDYRECVSGLRAEISKNVASEHLEQFGRARGRLVVGANEYSIDGLGERDHSWGVRDWNAPKQWTWLTCQFSEKLALNVAKLVVDQGVVDAGYIHINGENIPLIESNIRTNYDKDGNPKSMEVLIRDKMGNAYEVSATMLRLARVPFEGSGNKLSILYEPLARYSIDGLTGYGIAEQLIRKS